MAYITMAVVSLVLISPGRADSELVASRPSRSHTHDCGPSEEVARRFGVRCSWVQPELQVGTSTPTSTLESDLPTQLEAPGSRSKSGTAASASEDSNHGAPLAPGRATARGTPPQCCCTVLEATVTVRSGPGVPDSDSEDSELESVGAVPADRTVSATAASESLAARLRGPQQRRLAVRGGGRRPYLPPGFEYCLPHFVIAGAQKAGTTALFGHFLLRPDFAPPLRKETHYFDSQYSQSEMRRAGDPVPYLALMGPRKEGMVSLNLSSTSRTSS
jgi:hypothetical protein